MKREPLSYRDIDKGHKAKQESEGTASKAAGSVKYVEGPLWVTAELRGARGLQTRMQPTQNHRSGLGVDCITASISLCRVDLSSNPAYRRTYSSLELLPSVSVMSVMAFFKKYDILIRIFPGLPKDPKARKLVQLVMLTLEHLPRKRRYVRHSPSIHITH